MNARTWFSSLGNAAGVFVVLGILIAINVIASGIRLRKDMTEERLYTLSAGTLGLLGGLEEPVTLKMYYSKRDEAVPIPLKQYGQRVLDLLREYEAGSGGRVTLQVYDPEPDSEEEEWAQRYGVAGQPLDPLGGGPLLYFGLVGISGTREASIPFLAPSAEPQLEYLVTRLIYEVTRSSKPKVGVMSSLPVMGAPRSPFGPSRGPETWAVIDELRKQYELEQLGTDTGSIPEDLEVLLVIHPKNLAEPTLYALDQFVLRGGHLLAFVDPLCIAEQDIQGQMSETLFDAASDLNRLTEAWGFSMASGEVAADQTAASVISFSAGNAERTPAWLSLREDHIDRDEVATSWLDFVMLPFAGPFKGEAKEGLTASRLLFTSEDGGVVDSFQAVNLGGNVTQSLRKQGSQPLGLRLTGTFHTAFPEGKPAAAEEAAPSPAPVAGEHLAESRQPGVVILVGDADLLYDRFSVRKLNLFGQTLVEPSNDNLAFVLNMVEQLAGSEALIGLRSRGTFARPFDRVLALERQAQDKWKAEELKLQQKLQDTQRRISEIEAAKSQDQKFILSPEQKAEIDAFRQERFETQQQLKDVRKNLRKDIETLGTKVKAINMALVPSLVALFGIVRIWRRRRGKT